MAHDNTVLRHFVAKIVFPAGSNHQGTTILERNTSFSDRETLEQSWWHSNCPFTVDKLSTHPDCSQNSWQPSRALVSVLRSLVSCILPRLLSILSRHYSRVLRHFHKATWLDRQHSGGGNENRIGCSPDQFFPCGEKWHGKETRLDIPARWEGKSRNCLFHFVSWNIWIISRHVNRMWMLTCLMYVQLSQIRNTALLCHEFKNNSPTFQHTRTKI